MPILSVSVLSLKTRYSCFATWFLSFKHCSHSLFTHQATTLTCSTLQPPDRQLDPNRIAGSTTRQQPMAFTRFPDLPMELRLKIYRHALPNYGPCPVSSIFTIEAPPDTTIASRHTPSATPLDVTWALSPMPRDQWLPEYAKRVRNMQAMLWASHESRMETFLRFPAILGSSNSQMRFHPIADLVILASSHEVLSLFFQRHVSLSFAENWNKKVVRLAMPHFMVEAFSVDLFHQDPLLADLGYRCIGGFLLFLSQMSCLEQFFLIGTRPIFVEAWKRTGVEAKKQLLECFENVFQTNPIQLSATTSTEQETMPIQDPLKDHRADGLTRAVSNIRHVIHSHPESTEKSPFRKTIQFVGRSPKLKSIDIRKMYYFERELQGFCKQFQ